MWEKPSRPCRHALPKRSSMVIVLRTAPPVVGVVDICPVIADRTDPIDLEAEHGERLFPSMNAIFGRAA